MSLEESQQRFEVALEELNQECEKRGALQKAIVCNDYGVFIDFAGVEVNYSNYSLTDHLEEYLNEQEVRHNIYQRVLQNHQLQTKTELRRLNSVWYAFFQRFSGRPQPDEWEKTIDLAMIKVAFDKTLKEGALLGKYFFEEIVVDYTKNRFDDIRLNLVKSTDIIYKNAKDLEAIDVEKLQYFRNKELLWYGSKG